MTTLAARASVRPAIVGKPLSWAAGCTVLIAFVAFGVFHHDSMMPFALALLFCIPWVISFRQRRAPISVQIFLRIVLFTAVGFYSRFISTDFRGVLVYAGWVQLFTRVCMVELTLLHFGFEPYRSSSQTLPAVVFMSGMVFAAASKTVDVEALFIYFAVPYFFCLAFSLRGVRPRFVPTDLPWFAPKMWTHVAALSLVLMLGVGFTQYVGTHKRQLAPLFRISPFVQSVTTAQQNTTIGFSESPVLGSTQNMTRSMERVLSIRGSVPDSHLRGLAFESYNSGRWLHANVSRKADPAYFDQGASDPQTEITRLSDYISVLFVPLHSSGVSCERPELLECDAEHGSSLQAFASAPFRYQFRSSSVPDCQGPLCVQLSGDETRRSLSVPAELDLRVSWLAKDITRGCRTDMDRIHAIEGWLRSNIKYSLRTTVGNGDPVSNFVLNRTPAHCEYFASAATLMLRSVGIPARYVTGFYVHEKEGEGRYVVRQQDSHAWAEAWVNGHGWVTVEATPATGMPQGLGEKPALWRSVSEWFADIFYDVLHWFRARSLTQWIVMSAMTLVISATVAIWRRRRLRQLQKSAAFTYSGAGKEAVALAERFEHYLVRCRIPCPPACTWQEHLQMLGGADLELQRRIDLSRCREFVQIYSALRFGGGSELRLQALVKELDKLERAPSAARE